MAKYEIVNSSSKSIVLKKANISSEEKGIDYRIAIYMKEYVETDEFQKILGERTITPLESQVQPIQFWAITDKNALKKKDKLTIKVFNYDQKEELKSWLFPNYAQNKLKKNSQYSTDTISSDLNKMYKEYTEEHANNNKRYYKIVPAIGGHGAPRDRGVRYSPSDNEDTGFYLSFLELDEIAKESNVTVIIDACFIGATIGTKGTRQEIKYNNLIGSIRSTSITNVGEGALQTMFPGFKYQEQVRMDESALNIYRSKYYTTDTIPNEIMPDVIPSTIKNVFNSSLFLSTDKRTFTIYYGGSDVDPN